MALTPEVRPVFKADPSMKPASDIQPMVGVYTDAAGFMHRNYMQAPPPGVSSADGSAANAANVTPSDTVDLASPSRALYVGGAGNVSAVMLGGQTVLLTAVPAGTTLPLQVSRVNATLTTATLILALW